MAPLATMTSRVCFAVAPTAASMPSWRSRRWATTAKPAAATSEMSRNSTVARAKPPMAAALRSVPSCLETRGWLPPGVRNPLTRSSVVRTSTAAHVAPATAPADTGSNANSSTSLPGFSTRPTIVRGRRSKSVVVPTPAPSLSATPSVTASSSAPVG